MHAGGMLVALHRAVAAGDMPLALLEDLTKERSSMEECEVLDFKQQLPANDLEYSKTIRDLVALHNSYGGFIVLGVRELEKDRLFDIVGVQPGNLQLNKLRDGIRACTNSDVRIRAFSLSIGETNLEIVWVAKRILGELPVRFFKNGPESKPGKPIYRKGDVVFRRIENNAVAQTAEDYDYLFSDRRPPSLDMPEGRVGGGDSLENNLPDRTFICAKFVGRAGDIGDLWTWMADDFSRVRLIAGEGGLGKTSLAYRFSEQVAVRLLKPFNKVVWLTAKKRQFIAATDSYRDQGQVDFSDADSLFRAIIIAHAGLESDLVDLDSRALMQLAIESCGIVSSFIVVDDVDSLTPNDQLRVLELGMRMPQGTKLLLTTRVNFSYSPENVLKLDGLPEEDFSDYVKLLRDRYQLPAIKEDKIRQLRDVAGGSPLFCDSLIRLERRGVQLDQAMSQWRGAKGFEVRKAALQREILQLSREARRVLFVISQLKSCSYIELSRIVDYTEQTLGDALIELAGLFLISAPAIAHEARYTVEPNTGRLVLELAVSLGIDHELLISATKSLKADAVGLGLTKRSGIVGLAISQAMASLKGGSAKDAVAVIQAASKKLSKPHPDLLLALGRFSLKLDPPDYDEASRVFDQSYLLGQRKSLLYDLWYETEVSRGAFDVALHVARKAIEDLGGDQPRWYEMRAQVHIKLAQRSRSNITNDYAIREVDYAAADLRTARRMSFGGIQQGRLDQLLEQVNAVQAELRGYRDDK